MSLDIVSLFIRADNFTASAVCCRLMSSTIGSASYRPGKLLTKQLAAGELVASCKTCEKFRLRPVRESSLLKMSKLQRHFVPGYDRCCPYGTRLQTFRNSI